MSKETFKMFVRSNPRLLDYVRSNQMTWQKFYEMYDMYGENHSIWNNYIGTVNSTTNIIQSPSSLTKTVGDTPIKEIFNMVKQMDLETVRKGVDGLQKAVGLVQDLATTRKTSNYQARPLYQHLED